MIALYIIFAVLMFGVLIAVHEFGHFFTAKLLGVKVNEFAIGMGPAIFKKQKGETQYSLRAFPIGGFCSMEGEDEVTGDPRAFTAQKVWKRFIILAAGSVMNFLTGLIIILVIYSSARGFYAPVIEGFMDGFPLEGEDGLMVGDRIVSIDGEPIFMYSDLSMFLSRGNGEDFDLVIKRDGKKIKLDDFPLKLREYEHEGQTALRYGLIFGTEEATFGNKLKNSFLNSIDFVRLVKVSLVDLFSGRAGMKDMAGPIGIVGYMTQMGEESSNVSEALENLFYFAALIAINLAVMNLLPLPALDGGRIFFMLVTWVVEKIIRKKINPKYEGYIHGAGMLLLLGLMAVILFKDIFVIFKR